ncbi:hypothetical protein Plim_2572 [Planctopirus limnophila DSM 3776]|uniref:Uncharacterized protein n=1 Tax=Planctopirus limnophila (strain ATCC 43296 / DSM 3776 / IFAM 1008 / Mu 290) TaxID=521674 RepID=D5SQ22_PLAL2|nr:hypothetical protein [Planctopirus limnophila]ADG68397.1 hypothetical protein Plim_2572 [Planctopirus limnophila DSM 3776]
MTCFQLSLPLDFSIDSRKLLRGALLAVGIMSLWGCDQINPPAPEVKPVIGFKRDDDEPAPPPQVTPPPAVVEAPAEMKEPEPPPAPKVFTARLSAWRIVPTQEKGVNGLLFTIEFEALEHLSEVVLAEGSIFDNRNQEIRLLPIRDGNFFRITKFVPKASAAGAPYSAVLWWKGVDNGPWKEAVRARL